MQRKKRADVGDEQFSIVRKLQDFESPYISQKTASSTLKLVLRKASWDPRIDEELIAANKATLNLLYVQTLAEVEREWVVADAETREGIQRSERKFVTPLLTA